MEDEEIHLKESDVVKRKTRDLLGLIIVYHDGFFAHKSKIIYANLSCTSIYNIPKYFGVHFILHNVQNDLDKVLLLVCTRKN